MKRAYPVLASVVLLVILVLSAAKSQAALVEAFFDGSGKGNDGNDCSGFFGKDFGACTIFINDNNQAIKLSPVIAKFEYDNNFIVQSVELNNASQDPDGPYLSIDGSEFSVTSQNSTTGSWTYTPSTDDPSIKYWAVKAGNGFLLSWIVTDATNLANNCTGNDTNNTNYNLACLLGAEVVTAADWRTAVTSGISHITFYDTEPPSVVPLPAAIWLFLSALGAFFGFRRWKAAHSAA